MQGALQRAWQSARGGALSAPVRRVWPAAVLAVLAACGGGRSPAAEPTPGASVPSATLVAPETNGTLQLPFRLDLEATSNERLTTISVRENAARLTVDGASHTGVNYIAAYSFAGYDAFGILSISESGDDLSIIAPMCADGRYTGAWASSFRRPGNVFVPGTGRCESESITTTTTAVRLPALRSLPAPRRTGITIAGDGITLTDDKGRLVAEQKSYEILPIANVDCVECGNPPWLELWVLLRRDAEACFGLIYLFPQDRQRIQLDRALCFPTLTMPRVAYSGTWSGALAPSSRGATSLPEYGGRLFVRPAPMPVPGGVD